MEFFNKMSNLSEFNLLETLDYVFFKFPCFIESNLLCKGDSCCFESIQTRVASSLIFYVIWFLYSWFIVWFNDKVELRGILWRKMHEEKPVIEERKKVIEEHKIPEIKPEEIELPEDSDSTEELIKHQQLIREQEEYIKEEKKKMAKFVDELNTKKLKDMGFDITQNMIRCSNCGKWKTVSKKELTNKMKKHGIDIIWKYVCRECAKSLKKK